MLRILTLTLTLLLLFISLYDWVSCGIDYYYHRMTTKKNEIKNHEANVQKFKNVLLQQY
jgi:hypothetical protein